MSDTLTDIMKAQTALATLKQWLEDGLTLNDGARLEGAICLAEIALARVAALSAWAQRPDGEKCTSSVRRQPFEPVENGWGVGGELVGSGQFRHNSSCVGSLETPPQLPTR